LLERAALLVVGLAAVAWTFSRGSWLVPLFIGLSVFASLRATQLRPSSRLLTWSEWALGLALYGAALCLCGGVLWLAMSGAHLQPQSFSLGGAR
jgi:hypothetical protein